MYTPGYFKDKKITVMGLGLLGRGLGDIKFLAQEGAKLIVTDLKTKEELKDSLKELSEEKIGDAAHKITYVLGEHRLSDFKDKDFILKAAGVPLDSIYIEEARKNNIPVEMSTALFVSLTPAIIIGITGTRGKSTVTQLIYSILQERYKHSQFKIFLGGNVRGIATLPFLRETEKGDIAVLELDSWQLQGFGERKISPHIAVFTNFMNDHLNYYKNNTERYLEDKANIFLYQNQNDYLITGTTVAHIITAKYFGKLWHDPIAVGSKSIPHDWDIKLPGEHNRENIALAIKVATTMNIDYALIKRVVENFESISGRLEKIGVYKGVTIYNDTNATTPDATIVALASLGKTKNIHLIMGGADKNINPKDLFNNIPLYIKSIALLPGSGSAKIAQELRDICKKANIIFSETSTLEEAVTMSFKQAEEGDTVLLSPAFASFGLFKNEYDRGEQFNNLIQKKLDML